MCLWVGNICKNAIGSKGLLGPPPKKSTTKHSHIDYSQPIGCRVYVATQKNTIKKKAECEPSLEKSIVRVLRGEHVMRLLQ